MVMCSKLVPETVLTAPKQPGVVVACPLLDAKATVCWQNMTIPKENPTKETIRADEPAAIWLTKMFFTDGACRNKIFTAPGTGFHSLGDGDKKAVMTALTSTDPMLDAGFRE